MEREKERGAGVERWQGKDKGTGSSFLFEHLMLTEANRNSRNEITVCGGEGCNMQTTGSYSCNKTNNILIG